MLAQGKQACESYRLLLENIDGLLKKKTILQANLDAYQQTLRLAKQRSSQTYDKLESTKTKQKIKDSEKALEDIK